MAKRYTIVADNGAVSVQVADDHTAAVTAFLTQLMGQPTQPPTKVTIYGRSSLPGENYGKATGWRFQWENGFGFNVSGGG